MPEAPVALETLVTLAVLGTGETLVSVATLGARGVAARCGILPTIHGHIEAGRKPFLLNTPLSSLCLLLLFP